MAGASRQLRVPAGAHSGQDALPLQGHSHTPHTLRLGHAHTPVTLTCTSLGCGRKQESPEKTDTDVGRPCQLTDSGPSWESVLFSPQHYYKKTTLFEDLLYIKPSFNHLSSLSYFKRQGRHSGES